MGGRVSTSVVLRGTDLYVGTSNRQLHHLSTATGDVLSECSVEAEPHGPLLIAGESLLALLGEDVLVSVDLQLKRVQWTQTASKEWSSARPYLWREYVLAANRRELMALRRTDGTLVWSRQFPGTVRGIGATDAVLYVGTLQGPIYAYVP